MKIKIRRKRITVKQKSSNALSSHGATLLYNKKKNNATGTIIASEMKCLGSFGNNPLNQSAPCAVATPSMQMTGNSRRPAMRDSMRSLRLAGDDAGIRRRKEEINAHAQFSNQAVPEIAENISSFSLYRAWRSYWIGYILNHLENLNRNSGNKWYIRLLEWRSGGTTSFWITG